jgi:fructose-1,6-bisphosphatase/sedoheptulose 1,7-bisphosphatase-like protein
MTNTMKEEVMKEINAVVGYLSDSVAKVVAAKDRHEQVLEVRMERGSDETQVKINPGDIAGVLLGSSRDGETGVQVFLKQGAKVDVVSHGAASDLALRPIRDLSLVRARPPVNMIFLDAQLLDKLVQLTRKGNP